MRVSGPEKFYSSRPCPNLRMPTVSIIVPCYNGARFVAETLQSVRDQTLTDWECIVVDDGSTDTSAAVIEPFLPDPRFRYVYQENRGLSEARNTGMRHATGEFLQFLDADDLLLPTKLESQVAFLNAHPEYALVATGFIRTNEAGHELGRNVYPEGEVLLELLVEAQFVVHAALLRRSWAERVGTFEPSLRAAEDWDYWCRLWLLEGIQYRTADALVTYRQVGNAMTTNVERQTDMLLRVVARSHRRLQELQAARTGPLAPGQETFITEHERHARARVLLNGAARALAMGRLELAFRYLNQAQDLPSKFRDYSWEPWLRRVAFLIRHHQNANYPKVLRTFFRRTHTNFQSLAGRGGRALLLARLVNGDSMHKELGTALLRQPHVVVQTLFWAALYQLDKERRSF